MSNTYNMHPYHIIYNPYANRGGAERYKDAFVALLKRAGEEYILHETTGPGHATAITRDIVSLGAKYIVILGGDGTVHEVINGYAQVVDDAICDVVFGIIPAGTGNDVASMLRIPHALEDIAVAAADILAKNVRSVDFIQSRQGIQTMLFFSYGIAAVMVQEMEKFKTKTKFSYYKSLIKKIFSFKANTYEVHYDGQTRTLRADFCAVHNCIHAGAGMTLINNAVMDDGYAELLMVENRGILRRILNFISILRKRIHKQPNVQIVPVKNVIINSPDDNLCCIDGEIRYLNRLELEVQHKAIKIFGNAN
ncbi:MAG: diacylglycerol kinase family lipid kinase [Defluviitaleaceae bacterium]|nr:diacylglycerol kinase family lipid kinase [Defluviitaleaceae bacterium]